METDKPTITNDERDLLKRLLIAHADLQMALSAITFLGEELDPEAKYSKIELRRFKCFETTFIVSYARAFTKSKGSRHDQVSLWGIGVKLSAKERALHELIINLRQKAYAHSDESFAHVRMDVMHMDIPGGTFAVPHLQFDHGLEFAELFKRLAAMDLTHKIMDGLTTTVRRLAEKLPESFVYVEPSSRPSDVDYRDMLAESASATVIEPPISPDT
ncbi:hypothetical protein [Rhizobium leguminosarum]|uniref:HEPN AbiU2-like domain-containing protein n=1 Tax=Rhizobium leguminosarum TaxID=384 RepID=A0A7M3DW74_RHILE|nr:hypothetical protein [Rhizobium leguminosarum]TAY52941.1 hypothetical protein ELH90_15555 [Rhizobium leguminosarum]